MSWLIDDETSTNFEAIRLELPTTEVLVKRTRRSNSCGDMAETTEQRSVTLSGKFTRVEGLSDQDTCLRKLGIRHRHSSAKRIRTGDRGLSVLSPTG
ncbi:hypothetical protein PC116_g25052 [Phytophthora cactorum]|uniref:Uncharacterized protein n=1 Tax=Phytophthora cactorum TaxID=29920 RepID=A0A329RE81_9STRA|nr:hypothetical protein Pcac1_g25623 [Phytophthora cactorum]KAG2799469.1 hypothetical protein PC111_g20418 [Phytophthora cactorum]KAG2831801.1 hypothetical protein PC113_g20873 [Phytophthora cactorum]KAG2878050.1 hypothetical protein PC114_g23317 [Phytophthora cactorum]KAG2896860.1 hypothetical protein PC117_g22899 [Phytophthora cactorum]